MRTKEYKNYRMTSIGLIVSAMLLNQMAFAMQVLQDHDLRQIDGQDGIQLQTTFSNIEIDQLYWQDSAGTAANIKQDYRAVANNVKISKNHSYDEGNGAGNYDLGTTYQINAGANALGKTGLDFEMRVQPATISVGSVQLCVQTPSIHCDPAIGNLAIQIGSPMHIGLVTTDGLFNKDAQSELRLGLENMNIYIGLANAVANQYNQLILKNTNFNFLAKGVAYIDDSSGFILETRSGLASAVGTAAYDNLKATKISVPNTVHGYVDFTRVADPDQSGASTGTYAGTSAGLNLELMTKSNVNIDPTDPNYDLAGAKGLIRVGASGRIVNGFLQVRGIDTTGLAGTNNVLGFASSATQMTPTATGTDATVMGATGIGLRLRGEFTASGDAMLGGDASKATTLEIGGAGSNTYGFEFGEIKPLISNSNDRAYFDSGNVYINVADTKHLQMPENTVLNTSRLGGISNTYLTSSSDYIQQIHNESVNPYSLILAVRGADFQAVSKRGRFTSSSGVDVANAIPTNSGMDNQWGLGLPFYNLNANVALYSTKCSASAACTLFDLNNTNNTISKSTIDHSDRLGFALALSVEGKNTDGSKTTSIILVDGGDRDGNAANGIQATDYYIGLRNIDMLLSGYGSVGFENGNFNMSLPNLLMAMSAEIAAGYLPGAKYKSTGTDVPLNVFNSSDDVLLGLKMKLLGDMSFALIPNNQITGNGVNGNRLSIIGEYKLIDGTIQLSDPIDQSMVGFDKMSGLVRFNNAIVINKDNVGFNFGLQFNPERTVENVFRVRDINFYPPVASSNNRAQRLGEMVMTGGRLNADIAIRPRN